MTEQELLQMGYRKYHGEKIDIYFKRSMCTHSRVCLIGRPQVFNVRKQPWIDQSDELHLTKLIAVLDACPTKALRYISHEGGEEKWSLSKGKTDFIFWMKKVWKQVRSFMKS